MDDEHVAHPAATRLAPPWYFTDLERLVSNAFESREAAWRSRYDAVNKAHLEALGRERDLSRQNDLLVAELARISLLTGGAESRG